MGNLLLIVSCARAPIQELPSDKCEKFGETVSNEFIQTYNNTGCKLQTVSPEGRYLAYVTLSRQSDGKGAYDTDTVEVINMEEIDSEKEIHTSIRRDYIEKLEWSPYGESLMVWESVWEGHWALFVYDLQTGGELAKMRTDDLNMKWNKQNTAFYVTHTGRYGRDVCVSVLAGFDFQTKKAFPNFLDEFQVSEIEVDLFGMPYSISNTVTITPFGWNPGGTELHLAATPLTWLGDEKYQYELQPRQVGIIQLSESGPIYISLAADPSLDYSFEENVDLKINLEPYKGGHCP
ncbi:MAG: hypothetical protein JNM55_16355 [Anaerolineales bacterium]|nr:hypothetical protein [Anaerolineales bacterium]